MLMHRGNRFCILPPVSLCDLRVGISIGIISICLQFNQVMSRCRSGKIMRRLLRKIAVLDDKLGDTSTLADPSVVDTLIDMRGK